MDRRGRWALWTLAVTAGAFGWLRWQGRRRPAPMSVAWEGLFLDNPLRRRWFGPSHLLEAVGTLAGAEVAEVGVGVGVIAEALARAVGPGGRFYGVDIQPAAVEATRQRLLARGLAGRSRLAVADARRLPWDDGRLDLVAMVAMLGEVPAKDRVAALTEVRRVLKPQGRLAVTEFWPDPHYQPVETMRRWLGTAGFRPVLWRRAPLTYTVVAVPRVAGK